MISERVYFSKQIGLIIDSLFMILAFFVSYYLRKPFSHPPFQPLAPMGYYFWLLAVSLPFSWIALLSLDAYSAKPGPRRQFIPLFARFCLAMMFVLSLIFFVFSVREVNRSIVIPFVFLSAFFFALWRVLLMRWQRSRGIARKALLVGEGEKFPLLIEELRNHPLRGFELIGCLVNDSPPGAKIAGLPVLGTLDNLYGVLHREVVDEVIFGVRLSVMEQYQTLLKICETVGVNVLLLIDDQWPRFSRVDMGKLFNRPFIYLASSPVDEIASWMKAVLDRSLAFLTLLVSLPLMLMVGFLVKITSPGPILFVQQRTGLNGRRFKMYKFRTMFVDAQEKKAQLQEKNEMEGPVFKIKNDPRVTRIGGWLRKYSLDELPQFINVLKGDMSLVGPRPLPCEEAELIHGMQRRRFSVKPGLTCIWQISGRNQLSYEEWMKLDLQYIDRWSLGLDFKILLKTPAAIFSSKGAF
jgi:exopolysaccharide biosynthesis polyprenyl glycosylphosphotransferase